MRATLAIALRNFRPSRRENWLLNVALAFIALALFVSMGADRWTMFLLAALPLAAAATAATLHIRSTWLFAIPLYGRQLARACALNAIAYGLAAPALVLTGEVVFRHAASLDTIVWVLAGSSVAALVGLSATLRDGLVRAAYIVGGGLSGFAIASLASAGIPWFGTLAFAVLLGFVALRAFGETLARYDPIPEA
ncbi:MAG: hypothetical protein GIW95_11520 [Candidatus Eremiobacteraeota bacterium]|nr:hypothetical protein [Candidatus Eremiobacteraeota bacterium]